MSKAPIPIALFLALLATGCGKEEASPVDLGFDYFPRKVGSWIEYQVDSTWQDEAAGVTGSVSYRLREKVVEAYTDPAGRPAWRIHRVVRDGSGEWVVRDVWTSTMNAVAAEVAEENLRRLKLSFPVRDGRRWDINSLNAAEGLEVAFRNVGLPWTGDSLGFPQTVLVRNTVPANVVERRDFEERYAKGVGLVQKIWHESTTQSSGTQGWRLEMEAVAFGTE
ncbi:MAG: hypothetical protein QY325_07585 [Flavobacteriales bacterium]|nr:MAG: hypothetical protein QY325_07585 [Flavobacteriales bacterium]